MTSKRRSRGRQILHIDLTDIQYDSTCIDIIPNGLPYSVACDICKPKLCIHTKKSSKKKKKERNKHESNKCKQYWISKWGKSTRYITQGEVMQHIFTRRFLGIEQGVMICYDSFKKRKADTTLDSGTLQKRLPSSSQQCLKSNATEPISNNTDVCEQGPLTLPQSM